jgi:hypothetical protein
MDQARILLCDLCSPGELGCGRRQDAVKIQKVCGWQTRFVQSLL